MRIRLGKDIAAFRSVNEKYTRAVRLAAPGGEQFNLQTASGQYERISGLLKDKIQELELFTFCYEDEMESFAFHSSRSNEYVASALQDDFPLSKALRY